MSVFISKQLTVPSLSKALSDYAVGESVFIPVNGVQTEFLVVNQGKPSSVYDGSCDGTWLLMKDCYESRVWDATNNDYANSDIHAYLNGTFLGLFDSVIQRTIKQVKIPYTSGAGGTSVMSGASGLLAKIFLISWIEAGLGTASNVNVEGAVLDHFDGSTAADRLAYLNGAATAWFLRTPQNNSANYVRAVGTAGAGSGNWKPTSSYGIRPCIILPYDTKFDPDTNEVIV